MNKEKYYQPQISELYVGYSCEQTYDLEEYVPYIIDYNHGHLDFPQSTNNIRTKYLDSDDIISLGFELTERNFMSDKVKLFVNKELNIFMSVNWALTTPYIDIVLIDPIKFDKTLYPEHFKITLPCKSKNELKTILSWIS